MISKQVRECSIGTNSQARGTGEVIFADDTILHFIVIADVIRGDSVHYSFHLLAIAIVVEVGRRCTRDGDEAVFGVVVEFEGLSVDIAGLSYYRCHRKRRNCRSRAWSLHVCGSHHRQCS